MISTRIFQILMHNKIPFVTVRRLLCPPSRIFRHFTHRNPSWHWIRISQFMIFFYQSRGSTGKYDTWYNIEEVSGSRSLFLFDEKSSDNEKKISFNDTFDVAI